MMAAAPMELHEFCLMIPEHSPGEFRTLVNDLKKTGKLIEAITTFEGKVLDGRGRQKACAEAGIQPRYMPFQGTRKEAFAFVLSKNLARRHLTIKQRKILAAKMYKEDPTLSTNKVAKTVGLSPKTVVKDRSKGTFGKSKRRDTKGRRIGGRPKQTTPQSPTIDQMAAQQPKPTQAPQQRTAAKEAIAMLTKADLSNGSYIPLLIAAPASTVASEQPQPEAKPPDEDTKEEWTEEEWTEEEWHSETSAKCDEILERCKKALMLELAMADDNRRDQFFSLLDPKLDKMKNTIKHTPVLSKADAIAAVRETVKSMKSCYGGNNVGRCDIGELLCLHPALAKLDGDEQDEIRDKLIGEILERGELNKAKYRRNTYTVAVATPSAGDGSSK
jgi:hypothetical protein